MAFLLAIGTKKRLLCAAQSCHSALEASSRRDHQVNLLLLCAQLQQYRFDSRPRGPLWRGKKGIGKEALHVVGEVKRAKDDSIRLGNTMNSKVTRLLKTDLLAVLRELQRQKEVDLAFKIFNLVRKEVWYKPDIYLYKDMLSCLAKAKRVTECERLLKDLKVEGLPPDSLLLTEVMTAYLECGMLPHAMETFNEMRQGSVPPDLPAFKVLLRYLKKMGKRELRAKIKAECMEFYEGVVDTKFKRPRDESDEEMEMEWHQSAKEGENEEEGVVDTKFKRPRDESDEEMAMEWHQSAKEGDNEEEEDFI